MATIHELHDGIEAQQKAAERIGRFGDGGVDNGGEPPDDGIMEARLTALETRFDTILPTLATKADMGEIRADLHKMDSSIKTWTLATMLTIIGTMLAAIFGIAQIYKSSTMVAAPQQAQAPVIINVPQPAAAPQALPKTK